jgi:hypothetical protein
MAYVQLPLVHALCYTAAPLVAVGGGPELLLLRGLASQSLVYVPWFWSSAFTAALTAAAAAQEARHVQQQQQQKQDEKEPGIGQGAAADPTATSHNLLAGCAADFAVYMAGVGLPGEECSLAPIWVLPAWQAYDAIMT